MPVLSVNSGSGSATADFASGFLGNANDEVAKACAFLREHKELHGGFNLVGFSQGGQFARAVVQRCGCAIWLALRRLVPVCCEPRLAGATHVNMMHDVARTSTNLSV